MRVLHEHLLLDDVTIRREQRADAVGEILVVRHGRIIAISEEVNDGDLVLLEDRGLRWIDSPSSDAGASRGFWCECGLADRPCIRSGHI